MLRNKSIAVVGGDMRQLAIYEKLITQNNKAILCAFEKYTFLNIDLHTPYPICKDTLYGADIVILPLPAFINGKLNTPFSDEIISEEELISMLPKDALVFGGKLSSAFTKYAKKHGVKVYDYMNREDFAVLNAVPTAEGAISLAIQHTKGMISESRTLICGYGRIGKILAHHLNALGANVTVSARKASDLAWISSFGMNGIKTGNILYESLDYDIIINTIPELIFNRNVLSHIKNECIIIDLASLPGGVDFSAASEMGIPTFHALSLPGKTAPRAAGHIILSTIENILDEPEMS